MHKRIPTEHPGRILLEDFLAPKGVSVWRLANDIGVPARRLYEIVQGQRPINADIATASRITSACPSATGSTCRRAMTAREKKIFSFYSTCADLC
jgi:addiction module HigA family antidote